MSYKRPMEYELRPKNVDAGMRWLTLDVENKGDEALTSVDVKLNSLDTYSIDVHGVGQYIVKLAPHQQVSRHFQITANLTSRLYVSLDGWKGGEHFHWETPGILITVGEEVAELMSVFALTAPYPPPGQEIVCEAKVRGLADSQDLTLEFWSQAPSGTFAFDTVEIGALEAEEETTKRFAMEPEEEGSYTIHAYLYDGGRRIGHEVDHVYVVQP